MRQRSPYSLITNFCARRREICSIIFHEGNAFGRPVVACPVNLDRVCVPVVIRRCTALKSCAGGRLANGSRAVKCAVNSSCAVHHFHDVDFAALWPTRSVADTVAQHPDCWPHTLCIRCCVTSGTGGRLHSHDLAG